MSLSERDKLSSPSLSTGIDITFDGDATYFDCVYGIFEPQLLTHFGCDQQISRVRHPGVVKVYVSPRILNFETSLHVVQADLLSTSMFGHLLEGFEPSGRAIFNTSDELLKLAAMITSFERASTNRLRANFIAHLEQQGWSVQDEAANQELVSLGGSLLKFGKELVEEQIVDRLMNARVLSAEEFKNLEDRQDNEPLEPQDQDSYWRASIERFYGCPINPDVIRLDMDKQSREAVNLFAEVTDSTFLRLKGKIIGMKVDEKGLEEVVLANHRLRPMMLSHLISTTPLFDDARFRTDVEITTDGLRDFVAACRKIDLQYQTQFKKTLNQDLEVKPIKQLGTFLRMVGLKFCSRSSTKDGVKTYFYRIDPESLRTMQGIVDRQRAGRQEDDPTDLDHIELSTDHSTSENAMEDH